MFLPIRTDRPPKRTPIMTQSIVVLNLAVYLLGAAGAYLGLFDDPEKLAQLGHFDPAHFKAWQLVTYQFIHDPYGIWHIAFNMLFLWVFGAPVEDRLGRIGFLAFYVCGGVVAALAHAVLNPAPVIGASGAIAGVTGAFLALFPRSRIQILVVFFMIGTFSVPSLWFVAFYIGIDVLRQLGDLLGRGGSNVAYLAHLAGYAYGFAVVFLLLGTGVLKHEEFDVFYLFRQARRRAVFRAASRAGPSGMWESATADSGKRLKKHAAAAPPEAADPGAELRAEVYRMLGAGDLKGAARVYRQLPQTGTAIAEQGQVDIASQLYAEGAHAEAAGAYELFLRSYPSSGRADEVRLLLGLLYARHLGKPDRARELIEKARPRLRSDSHSRLADQLLAELAA